MTAEAVPEIIFTTDGEGRLTYINGSFSNYTGLEADTIGKWLEKVHPEDVPSAAAFMSFKTSCGRASPVEFRLLSSAGEYRWFRGRMRPVHNEKGEVTKWYGVCSDIHDLKTATEALGESEQRLALAIDAAGAGTWSLDLDTGGVEASARALEFHGLSHADHITHSQAFAKIHPVDLALVEQALADTINDHKPYRVEYRTVREDGSERWMLAQARLLEKNSRRRLIGLVQDITAQKEAERSLREMNETLEQRVTERTREVSHLVGELRALTAEMTQAQQRERRRLAGVLHDDIQQMLVGAQTQLAVLKRKVGDQGCVETVTRVEAILRDSVEESRRLTVELSPPILHQAGLASALSWLAARMEEQSRFKVEVQANSSANPTNDTMATLLFDSVRELLSNSLRHSGADCATVTMTRTHNNWTQIVIEDAGCGFDPQVYEAGGVQSSGYGIFSTQQRLTHFGGSMEIHSSPGQGARVTLLAPISIRSADDAADARKGISADGDTSIRVLLVDDHKILREGLVELLRVEDDLSVIGEAEDGFQALEMVRALEPAVVIMDVNLPGMNGIMATRVITERMPQVGVVGLSMHDDTNIAEAMIEAGAHAFLSKGGPSEALLRAIRECAGARTA